MRWHWIGALFRVLGIHSSQKVGGNKSREELGASGTVLEFRRSPANLMPLPLEPIPRHCCLTGAEQRGTGDSNAETSTCWRLGAGIRRTGFCRGILHRQRAGKEMHGNRGKANNHHDYNGRRKHDIYDPFRSRNGY